MRLPNALSLNHGSNEFAIGMNLFFSEDPGRCSVGDVFTRPLSPLGKAYDDRALESKEGTVVGIVN